jgi:hypothetical protein
MEAVSTRVRLRVALGASPSGVVGLGAAQVKSRLQSAVGKERRT